jgi:hypothetical protein
MSELYPSLSHSKMGLPVPCGVRAQTAAKSNFRANTSSRSARTSASRMPRMATADRSEPLIQARFSATPRLLADRL